MKGDVGTIWVNVQEKACKIFTYWSWNAIYIHDELAKQIEEVKSIERWVMDALKWKKLQSFSLQ